MHLVLVDDFAGVRDSFSCQERLAQTICLPLEERSAQPAGPAHVEQPA